jgi:hypothetical protein
MAPPATEPVTSLYGAGFVGDPDATSVEAAPIQPTSPLPASIASQAESMMHRDGSKLSGDELDRLQKLQIQQEQQGSAELPQQPEPQ